MNVLGDTGPSCETEERQKHTPTLIFFILAVAMQKAKHYITAVDNIYGRDVEDQERKVTVVTWIGAEGNHYKFYKCYNYSKCSLLNHITKLNLKNDVNKPTEKKGNKVIIAFYKKR